MKTAIALAILLALIVLCITGRISDKWLIGRFFLYLDIFACSLVLGDADETISSRCGLALKAGHPRPLCWLGHALNWLQPRHCTLAIAHDIRRARQAIEQLLGDH